MSLPDTLYVEIEWRHIHAGERNSWNMCPIARAIRWRWEPNDVLIAEDGTAHVQQGAADSYRYYECKAARAWIKAFDAGRAVQPQTFVFKRCGS